MNARRGFTLIELLVVMVIVGMLLSTVPAAFNKAVPGTELKSAARRIATGLRFARNQAITKNQEVALKLNLDQRQFVISDKPKTYSLPQNQNIKIELFTAESELSDEHKGGAIRFFPDGSSTGGQVTLTLNKREYKVDINWLTGRVVIFE